MICRIIFGKQTVNPTPTPPPRRPNLLVSLVTNCSPWASKQELPRTTDPESDVRTLDQQPQATSARFSHVTVNGGWSAPSSSRFLPAVPWGSLYRAGPPSLTAPSSCRAACCWSEANMPLGGGTSSCSGAGSWRRPSGWSWSGRRRSRGQCCSARARWGPIGPGWTPGCGRGCSDRWGSGGTGGCLRCPRWPGWPPPSAAGNRKFSSRFVSN